MEIYNYLNYNLKARIDFKVKKDYFKNNIAPQIEKKYKDKIKNKMFSVYYLIFHDYDYIYYLSLLESDILYYLNNHECFRDIMNDCTKQFLSKCFKKNINNNKDYILASSVLFKKDLVIKLLNNFTISQIDDFYNNCYNKHSLSF